MASLDRPKLRPLSGRRVEHRGQSFVALDDSLGLAPGPFLISLESFQGLVRHFDGQTSLDEIRSRVYRDTGRSLDMGDLVAFVAELDRAMVLEGPTHRAFLEGYSRGLVRPSCFAGRSYPSDVHRLEAELGRYFTHPKGAGIPNSFPRSGSGSLRAILSPHIDFGRGGRVYSHAYRALIEQSDADVFVILGVAHQYCRHRFALTRKDFSTPLGTAATDRSFVDHLIGAAGAHLFRDELAHRSEHSIEFQVVFLQYVLGERRPYSIVPVLVGSFHDLMQAGTDPIDDPEVRRMVEAFRSAEAASGKKVVYIGGIDLCHVGPEFGDPASVDDRTLEDVRAFDRTMLDRASAVDPAGWFYKAAEIRNRWRVCGLSATYTLLHAIGPARGRVLSYDQAIDPARTCCVTFASVAYESPATQIDA